nr:MAG TPA: hypothetical protein [Caudoviricetes sp.]
MNPYIPPCIIYSLLSTLVYVIVKTLSLHSFERILGNIFKR